MNRHPSMKRSIKSKNTRRLASFGEANRPLLVSPFGPMQPWILPDLPQSASSGAPPSAQYGRKRKANKSSRKSRSSNFGYESLEGKRVTPAGYVATWEGFPRTPPPSWNPLLLQGENNFVTSLKSPTLKDVGFGKKRRTRGRKHSDY